mmetsp:Transcript_114860/g.198945  ORF Transcript_114860/g.198945 Transcript_114860/m.198945 type:complete len:227 (-) Transcript_114860:926-1606(-)
MPALFSSHARWRPRRSERLVFSLHLSHHLVQSCSSVLFFLLNGFLLFQALLKAACLHHLFFFLGLSFLSVFVLLPSSELLRQGSVPKCHLILALLCICQAGKHVSSQLSVVLQEKIDIRRALVRSCSKKCRNASFQLHLSSGDLLLRRPRKRLQHHGAGAGHLLQKIALHRQRSQSILQDKHAAIVEILLLVHVGDEGSGRLLLELHRLVRPVGLPFFRTVATKES